MPRGRYLRDKNPTHGPADARLAEFIMQLQLPHNRRMSLSLNRNGCMPMWWEVVIASRPIL